jgi:hypothetical protein
MKKGLQERKHQKGQLVLLVLVLPPVLVHVAPVLAGRLAYLSPPKDQLKREPRDRTTMAPLLALE